MNHYVVTRDEDVPTDDAWDAHGPFTLGEARAFKQGAEWVNDSAIAIYGVYAGDTEEAAIATAKDGGDPIPDEE